MSGSYYRTGKCASLFQNNLLAFMSYGLKFAVLESILPNTQMHVRDWPICNPCLNIDQARFWFIACDSFWLPYKIYKCGKIYSNESIRPQENARWRTITLRKRNNSIGRAGKKSRPWWFSHVPQKLIPSTNIRRPAAQKTMPMMSGELLINRCDMNKDRSTDTID